MKRENQEEILGRHIEYMVSSPKGESNRSTNHMNEILVLMQNYGDVQKYMDEAAKSSGSSLTKYEAYTDSLTGKLEGFKNSFQNFSTSITNTDVFGALIDGGSKFLNILSEIISFGNGIPAILGVIGGTQLFKNLD